jgi:hypothetical protein
MLCRQFAVAADAWDLLCGRLALDPELPLRGLPGCEAVREMGPVARGLAFTEEQARDYLRARGGGRDGHRPWTALDLAGWMRDTLVAELAGHTRQG